MSILDEIVANRKRLIDEEEQTLPLSGLIKRAEDMLESGYVPTPFINSTDFKLPFLIAEIKKRSPSKGLIREDFDVASIAGAYNDSAPVNGISILTEPDYFGGSYENCEIARTITSKPILMKDFIIDEYQIYKAFVIGASAVLFIASVLDNVKSLGLSMVAEKLGLAVLFETHDNSEYSRALEGGYTIIGINNRDLKTFNTDIRNSIDIVEQNGKPKNGIVISESGIHSREDIKQLLEGGVDGFLIGERFMKSPDIAASIEGLFGPGYH